MLVEESKTKKHSRLPEWVINMQNMKDSQTSLVDCCWYLLDQFCVLKPIRRSDVVAHRWLLLKARFTVGEQLMPLDEVVKLSLAGRGLMQCNCTNGMHYGLCPHSCGWLLHCGILKNLNLQYDAANPNRLRARGVRGNTGSQKAPVGPYQRTVTVVPVIFRKK